MFDFTDHYTLSELLALDNFMCYVRAKAAESVDLRDLRSDLNKEHRALSRIINSRLDEAAEEWDLAQQAEASIPPASAPPAEDLDGLCDPQALVDDLNRCSARLAALADLENVHFAECSLVEVYNKVILLRGASRSVSNLVSNIRDHYDGLH